MLSMNLLGKTKSGCKKVLFDVIVLAFIFKGLFSVKMTKTADNDADHHVKNQVSQLFYEQSGK